jgi:hypothetical protein
MYKTMIPLASLSICLFAGCESLDINEADVAQAVEEAENGETPVATSTQTDASGQAINWLGPNLSGAAIDGTLTSANVSGNNVVLDYSIDWATRVPKGMGSQMQGMVCMFRDINGTLVGGKFEWFRKGQSVRGLQNIKSGYNGHTVPGSGETVYFCLADVTGSKRTALVSTTW